MTVETPDLPVELFYSYCHVDEKLRKALEKHLSVMQNEGLISGWHDRKIGPGKEWEVDIHRNIRTARIILLLISKDFLASEYCYKKEMEIALNRHEANEAVVIPVILRQCDWENSPFSKLLALPRDGKAITGRGWKNQDEAFTDVAKGIRSEVMRIRAGNSLASKTGAVKGEHGRLGPGSSQPTPIQDSGIESKEKQLTYSKDLKIKKLIHLFMLIFVSIAVFLAALTHYNGDIASQAKERDRQQQEEEVKFLDNSATDEFPEGPLSTNRSYSDVTAYLRKKWPSQDQKVNETLNRFSNDPIKMATAESFSPLTDFDASKLSSTDLRTRKEYALGLWVYAQSLVRANNVARRNELTGNAQKLVFERTKNLYPALIERAVLLAPKSISLRLYLADMHLNQKAWFAADGDYNIAVSLLTPFRDRSKPLALSIAAFRLGVALRLAREAVEANPMKGSESALAAIRKDYDVRARELTSLLNQKSAAAVPKLTRIYAEHILGLYLLDIASDYGEAVERLARASRASEDMKSTDIGYSQRLDVVTDLASAKVRGTLNLGIFQLDDALTDLVAIGNQLMDDQKKEHAGGALTQLTADSVSHYVDVLTETATLSIFSEGGNHEKLRFASDMAFDEGNDPSVISNDESIESRRQARGLDLLASCALLRMSLSGSEVKKANQEIQRIDGIVNRQMSATTDPQSLERLLHARAIRMFGGCLRWNILSASERTNEASVLKHCDEQIRSFASRHYSNPLKCQAYGLVMQVRRKWPEILDELQQTHGQS